MSKAFTPPDTMSDEDILAVADVRRGIWTGGFKGLGGGLLLGYVGHLGASLLLPAKFFPPKFKQNKYAFLWSLGLGAAGSFVSASSAGKNQVHGMYDVFSRGAKPQLSDYQEAAGQGQDPRQAAMESSARRANALESTKKQRAVEKSEMDRRTFG